MMLIVLDAANNPKFVDFYQIKTDNKASRYITPNFITKDADKYPDKMSISQKMIENFSNFENEASSIHLVSNKYFNFGELTSGEQSTDRAVLTLYEVLESTQNKIKKNMCQACHLNEQECENKCVKIIHFNVSFLNLVNFEETVLGKFINCLSEMEIESSISKTKTKFLTILGEIKRVNNWGIEST